SFSFAAPPARAPPLAPSATKPVKGSRNTPCIRFLRLSIFAHDLIRKPVPTFRDHALKALGHFLVPPDEGALLFELCLQLFGRNVSRNRIARQRQRRCYARRLPHGKAGAGDPSRRLPVMG